MNNSAVAEALWQLARLYDVEGDNQYKTRAYERAARVVEDWPEPMDEVMAGGRLQELPGVGKSLAALIEEIWTTGTSRQLEDLRASHPPQVLALLSVPGITVRQAHKLFEGLGVGSVDELEAAARQGRVRTVLSASREARLIQALDQRRARQGQWILAKALDMADVVLRRLRRSPHVSRAELAGSARRGEDLVTHLDFVVLPKDGSTVADIAGSSGLAGPSDEPDGFVAVAANGCPIAVHVAARDHFGWAWIQHTGPEEHVNSLTPAPGEEEDVYRKAGLPWVPPEVRGVPLTGPLMAGSDLQGDLHAHSDWSDGTTPIEAMAAAARVRGYRYLAMTDHSQSLRVARGLSPEQLVEQGRLIDALNAQWSDFRLLKGTECDILEDGRMDFPDEVLATLDVVVGSVHSHFDLDSATQTRRLLSAMQNPHVDVIGHLTGRQLLKRPGIKVDWDQIQEGALRTRTALELNGSPHRMDVEATRARALGQAGVWFSVDSDAHHPRELGYIHNGVRMARRAGLRPDQIINTRPLPEFLTWLYRCPP